MPGSARAHNSENQYELIQECANRFAEEKTFKLLVRAPGHFIFHTYDEFF